MVSVQNVSPNLYHMNFKADGNRNNNQYQQPVDRQVIMMQKYEKEQKRQKRLQTAAILASIAAAGAIIFSVFGRGGGGRVEREMDKLTNVPIEWKIFDSNNKVAPLTSETTAKTVREEFQNIINLDKLSEKAKKWAGIKDKPRMYYMYGESGVGKTYAVQQLAQEMGAQYTCIKFGEIGTAFQNTTSARVLNMFRKIAEEASKNPDKKYVVCIDEIDSLLRKISERSGEEAQKDRGAILTGMDELAQKCKNVTLIATSNFHPNSKLIDQASMRRFKDGKIEVPLPDVTQTKALLKMYLNGPEAIKESFFNSSEFKNFAKKLSEEKYSNAEIQNIAEKARDYFGKELVGVADKDVENVKFTMEALNKAKKLIGKPASLTNDTMKI